MQFPILFVQNIINNMLNQKKNIQNKTQNIFFTTNKKKTASM